MFGVLNYLARHAIQVVKNISTVKFLSRIVRFGAPLDIYRKQNTALVFFSLLPSPYTYPSPRLLSILHSVTFKIYKALPSSSPHPRTWRCSR